LRLDNHLRNILCAATCLLIASSAFAQQDPPVRPAEPVVRQTAANINFAQRPRYPYEPQRLRLRPVLDGVIGENEWTPLYTIDDQAVQGTVYVNWDDDFLYVAASTSQPAWLVFSLDSSADGWSRGADNLELTVAPLGSSGHPPVSARILDGATNRDGPVWNDKVVDTGAIPLVAKAVGSGQVIEMAIPKGTAGLSLRPNVALSCRADLLPENAAPAPVQPFAPRLLVDITLVEAKSVAAPGIAPRLRLEDDKLIAGQPLRATFEISNQTDTERRIRSITWQGEAAAEDLLKTVREVNLPPLRGLKTLRLNYSSTLPDAAIPGFYKFTATAQLDNGAVVSSTTTFSVLEPIGVQMLTEPDSLTIVGPTPLRVSVDIFSAVPGRARGDVEIEVPVGWEVKGRRKKEFVVEREDASSRSTFFITVPSTTQAGEYIVHATVTWRGKTWKARRVVRISRVTETPAPSANP
jgi:hypothetical protein